MKFKIHLLLALVLLISSCENNDVSIDQDNLLLGNWVAPIYDGETTTFERSGSLPDEAYGISFKQDGSFLERTSGFCGTPPLTFFNVEGNFELNESLVQISTNSYPSFFQWRIVELSEKKLIVKRELSEQEKEHRALMDLFSEIENMAYITCNNSNDWAFTAYGSKACGGPQGYIPYSKNINTTLFFEKIEAYTKAEKEFNIKWGIISNCAIVNPPKSVTCNNRFPILNY
ncbi:hypothetical protein [Polaribacter porphyrae]|uniref:Lipocalin-like domain-containing protein n=1 Tax=Polaribacter porphyrae TaxID=1137780 RepID=A0A2S7WR08_9FLAO|nr:hypothetical protein [Polaribacter porphyrae]PQJ80023.1 hypothetical protein BTO18_12950 [Polaribacter porphyrae]